MHPNGRNFAPMHIVSDSADWRATVRSLIIEGN
jgi:hypothetical protein